MFGVHTRKAMLLCKSTGISLRNSYSSNIRRTTAKPLAWQRSPLLFYSTKPQSENAAQPQKHVLSGKPASWIRRLLTPFLPLYQGQNIGKAMFQICTTYPDHKGFWIDECQLPDTFQTWFSTTSLYVWMAMVRIRADSNAKHYNQGLVDSFFIEAERKIRASGVKSGRIVNDTLKDLVSSFKGTVMALDEGFARSDAVLAAAVWRNLVPEDKMLPQVDTITRFIRSQLAALDKCSVQSLVSGEFAFPPVRS
ncbi:Ubiquinol cytochrome-c reductase assembly protein Cbp3 [Coemansia spiralis]|uniref:Ubiquinol cytochrome-c reductase assembly protein Cbp3 n=2 Tax=Coemansia TaxID=4863 RepID=A0A9W8G2J3_9FUNG|nr:Ubiquinol cytochrome-c reductase assembly protein Cbp3 [Coemansia umbellata]KAJ2619764.1 Ubiquinol cytochrome-c reductase assembly protein Cbp3 [Coemansia sp. RSA 1358]KAJ2671947.1 Ubiquinol cytochrome-c reductase assembly protein Cbp3 [Coemansia spiralis]